MSLPNEAKNGQQAPRDAVSSNTNAAEGDADRAKAEALVSGTGSAEDPIQVQPSPEQQPEKRLPEGTLPAEEEEEKQPPKGTPLVERQLRGQQQRFGQNPSGFQQAVQGPDPKKPVEKPPLSGPGGFQTPLRVAKPAVDSSPDGGDSPERQQQRSRQPMGPKSSPNSERSLSLAIGSEPAEDQLEEENPLQSGQTGADITAKGKITADQGAGQ